MGLLLAPTVALAGMLAAAEEGAEVAGQLDVVAVARVHDLSPAPLVDASLWLATAGSSRSILLITAVSLLALAASRSWRVLCALALAVGAEQVVVAALKGFLERPRPTGDNAFAHAAGFSLPSGHAAASAALFGLLAWAVARSARPAVSAAVLAGACTFILLMGASRVVLGVHYPSDVLAGWLAGAAIASVAWLLTGRLGRVRVAVRA